MKGDKYQEYREMNFRKRGCRYNFRLLLSLKTRDYLKFRMNLEGKLWEEEILI